MQAFAMLTRLTAAAAPPPHVLEELEHKVMEHARRTCPAVVWVGSYAILGPYDYLDIFRAPDIDTASRVSVLIRTYGHAHTEIWPLTEWGHFKTLVRDLGLVAA